MDRRREVVEEEHLLGGPHCGSASDTFPVH